jgi:hypothetical protein
MRSGLKLLLGAAGMALATQAVAQATLYDGNGYLGRFVTADTAIPDLGLYQLNGRVASASISSGRWESCSSPDTRAAP